MWLYRIIDTDGKICWALKLSADSDALERVSGQIPGKLKRTGLPVEARSLLAPVRPPVIFGIGLNYRSYADQIGKPPGAHPLVFMKQAGAVVGPEAAIHIPGRIPSKKVDYEGELAVVIGRSCKNVSPKEAMAHVVGFCCANDVTARDWQFDFGSGQFSRSKTFDTFCPLGPAIRLHGEWAAALAEGEPSAVDEFDPANAALSTHVNGELRQQGTTADLIFSIAELIAYLSADTRLEAGTVILTGTPAGTGSGQSPECYLRPGDLVEIEIKGIGTLRNTVAV